jgi:hypothetical protein
MKLKVAVLMARSNEGTPKKSQNPTHGRVPSPGVERPWKQAP